MYLQLHIDIRNDSHYRQIGDNKGNNGQGRTNNAKN